MDVPVFCLWEGQQPEFLFSDVRVGATRQGLAVSWSGIEPLQIITSDGIDGSPLHGCTIYNLPMTKFDPQKHHRRSIRLKGYDYSQEGAYYVTIVTWRRDFLFGEIINKEMRLNKVGKIVEWEWLELPKRLSYVELGEYVVMPNHFHGILFIHENVGAISYPLGTRQGQAISQSDSKPLQTLTPDGMDGSPLAHGPKPASLGAIIAQFKSRATKRIWKFPEYKETPIWQRNYYEHIIRNETDLQNKTDYIESNPRLWDEDDENPVNVKK